MTSIAREHLTRNKKHCNSAQTTCTCLQWFYWICMQRGYISVVEHSAAVQEVPSSNPGVPLYNCWKTRETWHRSREYTWLGAKNIVTVLKQPARVCSDIESVCSGERAYSSVVEHSAAVREVPGLNPGVPLYNFWKTREKWHRSPENTWLGTKKNCNSAQTTCTCLQWFLLNMHAAGIQLSGRAFICSPRDPWFEPGCPLV